MDSFNKEDYEAKDRAFYSAMINGWLNTKLECDKQLLSLSVTAIGLLVTLLRTVGVVSITQLILFTCDLVAFLITVISVICVLDKNASHIEKILNGSNKKSKVLEILDRIARSSFVIGMVMIVVIGVHSAKINIASQKGTNMNREKSFTNTDSQSIKNNDSWNGASKLRPQLPKTAQIPPITTPNNNPSNPSESLESSGSGNTSGSSSKS